MALSNFYTTTIAFDSGFPRVGFQNYPTGMYCRGKSQPMIPNCNLSLTNFNKNSVGRSGITDYQYPLFFG